MKHDQYRVKPGSPVRLADLDPSSTGNLKNKREGVEKLEKEVARLVEYQDKLYAHDTYALLIVLQAMDTAGKDGIIRHVMSGLNPQGTSVHSFKAPSAEELDHDFLWRCMKALPERGRIGVFNRSYYEEVIVVRVHPEILAAQKLPPHAKGGDVWTERFEQINDFESYLSRNGIVVMKFFLHLSKEEQRERLLARIDTPEKNWKVSIGDIGERRHWDEYMSAYEAAINSTSTESAPWYVIPADRKWFARAAVAEIIADKLDSLGLAYPSVSEEQLRKLADAKKTLEAE